VSAEDAPLAILGAVNVDLVVRTERLPATGETVTGGEFSRHHGGKGGNQAVAAARALERPDAVALVGAVGRDDFGKEAMLALAAEGVDEAELVRTSLPTGVALIVVDAAGENQIAVAPGANGAVNGEAVTSSLQRLRPAMVLASLEVPRSGVLAAAEWCRASGVPFVLNPAPVQPWTTDLLGFASVLTPNERERAAIGVVPADVPVVETRGSQGARIDHEGTTRDVRAPAADAVDTTGAGDCFNGVLAAGLIEGRTLLEAVERATVASALSVTQPGARDGMPTRAEIDAAVGGLA
jgi:ribokinase